MPLAALSARATFLDECGNSVPPLHEAGYANPDLYAFWSARDPIPAYAARLQAEELIDGEELDRLKSECQAIVEFEAQEVIAADWPPARQAGEGVYIVAVTDNEIAHSHRGIDHRRILPGQQRQMPALKSQAPGRSRSRHYRAATR